MAKAHNIGRKLAIPSEVFDEFAKKYENGLGGSQRDIARGLLERAPPILPDSVIHDNACGPAILTGFILERSSLSPPRIYATDYAQGMVQVTNAYKEKFGWDSVTAEQMDGQDLKFEDNMFTHSLSSLGVFMFPDHMKGLAEMRRTLKPGGWIGVTSWKDVRWPPAARAAYEKMFPNAKEDMILPQVSGWDEPENCVAKLRAAGFKDVRADIVQCINRQPSIKVSCGYFTAFLRNFSPTARAWGEETWRRYCEHFEEFMEPMYSRSTDGSGVELVAAVIVTSGTK
ncbi:hypothetical protein ABW19_dt0210242 [Dactylella cylindrospora]|nr:hypothetical protein ABW19_dt0210242 [Dactylella cylindrospora]